MNYVSIQQSHNDNSLEIFINGEAVSSYSDLNAISKHNFFDFSKRLFGLLDNEIFDEYEVEYKGTPFQCSILQAQKTKSNLCKLVKYMSDDFSECLKTQINSYKAICKRNGIYFSYDKSIKIFSEIENNFLRQFDDFETRDIQIADVCILRQPCSNVKNGSLCFIVGSEYGVEESSEQKIIRFPALDFKSLAEFIEFEYIIKPELYYMQNKLEYAELDKKDRMRFDYIKTGKPSFYLNGFPEKCDQGSLISFEFLSFPENEYHIIVENNGIAKFEGNVIHALQAGFTNVAVINSKGERFRELRLECISHNYLQEIRLIPKFRFLSINKTGKIDAILVPNNAEDGEKIKWESSNPSVVQVDQYGNVTALNNGMARIIVKGKAVSAYFDVVVSPIIESVDLSEKNIFLHPGQEMLISAISYPVNAEKSGYMWQIDNNAIASYKILNNNEQCLVKASKTQAGKGNLFFADKVSGLKKVIPIEVSAKMKPLEKLALILIVIGSLIPFLEILPIGIGFYGIHRANKKSPIFSTKMSIISLFAGIVSAVLYLLILAN